MKTKKAGFTLVELLVVIAIIAILMAILVPALRRAKEGAMRVVCANQCKQIHIAMSAYIADYDGKLPWDGEESTPHPYAVYRMDGASKEGIPYWDSARNKGVPMRFACLYEGKYMPEPKVFYCPSNRIDLYKYKSYIDPPPWGSLPQKFNTGGGGSTSHNQWVRIGYTYYPTSPWGMINVFTGAPKELFAKTWARLDPRLPYLTDVMRHKDQLSHKIDNTYALHALFKDGHVLYCNDQSIFNDPIWDEWERGDYDDEESAMRPKFYYRVLKLIGQ